MYFQQDLIFEFAVPYNFIINLDCLIGGELFPLFIMADCCKSKKSFQKVLRKYDFEFPGMAKIPRTAISFVNLKPVDIHIAKKKLELLNRIPTFDADTLRSCGVSDLGKKYMPLLVASGYCSVALEIKELLEEEKLLLQTPEVSGRTISFVENPELMTDLIEGLIECADSEKRCGRYKINSVT